MQAGEAVDTQVCQLVAAALKEIGGNITISQIDNATLIDRVFKPRIRISIWPRSTTRPTSSTRTS